ncbi:MAG: ATP-binding protein [Chloroflexota bacterium]|nr:ATP-binding protein [Chloroflexota bacterium]MDE2884679.1 ATP-binding protein [Chloroflexota bacterium]
MIQPLRFFRVPSRISTQLQLVIAGAVALTLAASLVGWFSFSRVSEAQSLVNDASLPEITTAFHVAEAASALVTAAPRLTSAQSETFPDVVAEINEARRAFDAELAALERRGSEEERLNRIREQADKLVANIDRIKVEMQDVFTLEDESNRLRERLTALQSELDGILIPALDDQLFYLMTGYTSIDAPATSLEESFSGDQIIEYRRLAELQGALSIAAQVLASTFTVSEPALVEPLRERFEAAFAAFRGPESTFLAQEVSPELLAVLEPVETRLHDLGLGNDEEEGGFALVERGLILAEQQRELLAENRTVAIELVGEVDGLVNTANQHAQEATLSSDQSIRTGRTLLIAIGIISVTGALLIDWLFVWRMLLRRLEFLSNRMRRMAGGELEEEVVVSGRDEVADMAAALEVFRRNALEVQRLNLVEHLAEELREKNDELESALSDLDKAQDQIVMREKLAALGELTAGVAHEIRNPLNFVKNFSEASAELLVELKEAVDDTGDALTDDQKQYIEEISADLTGNLERIQSHGERANRIVQDMLMMGRGGGEARPIGINDLVNEHASLAYHSARALDPDFQLTIRQEFDADAGEVEAIPGDLGRVFLNMVSNACYAVDEKRKQREAEGDREYLPEVLLSTKRTSESVEVRIRDNGSGIPQEAIDKIFNPFFTTKPTDKGTGLGLAISNDIVRQHGGTISVTSEAGEFTEMLVTLPFRYPVVTAEYEHDAGGDNDEAGDEDADEVDTADADEEDDADDGANEGDEDDGRAG